jgi:hypothetical protein
MRREIKAKSLPSNSHETTQSTTMMWNSTIHQQATALYSNGDVNGVVGTLPIQNCSKRNLAFHGKIDNAE